MKSLILTLLLLLPLPAMAQDKSFNLSVPPALAETGLIDYLLPRFSLKTGVRATVVQGGSFGFGDKGTPVFRGVGNLWRLGKPATPAETRFADWLTSDIGKRTVESFEGSETFSADVTEAKVIATAALTGDAARGKTLSLDLCGHCHVIGPENRLKAIGSSPSFMLMRSFPDWRERFDTFYELRPHAPFTDVTGVTGTPAGSPSTRTIKMDRADVDAITAFVGGMAPADLGAPLQSQ